MVRPRLHRAGPRVEATGAHLRRRSQRSAHPAFTGRAGPAQGSRHVFSDWALRAATAPTSFASWSKPGTWSGTIPSPILYSSSKAPGKSGRSSKDCNRALTDAVGEHSNLFRPPFGGRRPAVLRMARQMGLEPIMWNVTGYDWNATSAEQIERKVTRQVRGGDVILLHDGGHRDFGADRSYTVTATDRLISRYKSEGYEFVTIPEMMRKAVVRSIRS